MRSTLLLFTLSPLAFAQVFTTSTSTTTSWWTATSTRTVIRVNAAATSLSNTLTENVNGASSSSNALTENVNGASSSSNALTENVSGASPTSNALTENVNGASPSTNALTENVSGASSSSLILTEAVAGSNSSTVVTELIASATGAAGAAGPNSALTVAVQGQGSNAPFQMPNATNSGLQFGVKGTGTGVSPAQFTGAGVRANSVAEFGRLAAVAAVAMGAFLL
ncbi:MAG: hypothetical protein M1821_004032 [Bathelium mastoideum]|nr:MAG: hypothetical protein M1821_004032 [Bathelium mastoideum]